MNEIKEQVNVIQIAVNSLKNNVKCPKEEMQQSHFCSAIREIETAVNMLKELIARQNPES